MKRSNTMFNIKSSDGITPIGYYTYYCDACNTMVGVSENNLIRVSDHAALCVRCYNKFMGLSEESRRNLINAISMIYECKKTIKNILEDKVEERKRMQEE